MTNRPTAVAGLFYPGDPQELEAQVNYLLAAGTTVARHPKALIVPHAGYVYSGATAGRAYGTLEAQRHEIHRVVLMGPAHRVYLEGMAVPSVGSFATPLGPIPLDEPVLEQLRALPGVIVDDEAHRQEHSLEVHLPFLKLSLDAFRLVPIVVGRCAPETVARVVDWLWGGPETLVVISSDLSHFHSDQDARAIDTETSLKILRKETTLLGEEACGATAINGLMASDGVQDLEVVEIDRCNSADTAGDPHRVVGYGSYALC